MNGKIKLKLGACKGKKNWDKRDSIKKRDIENGSKNPIIGKRSFSADPEVVVKMNSAYIRAFEKNKVVLQIN